MKKVSLEVNGKKIVKEIPDHTILSVLLRDILNLTGTHIGCDTSQCGACVVHVDGKSIKSCTAFAADLNGSKITDNQWLNPGDTVTLEIEELGMLTNQIILNG